MIVQKNKTFYVGSRKFVEGDILPPFVGGIRFEGSEEKQVEEIIKNNDPIEEPKKTEEKPKEIKKRGPGRPRKNVR